MPRFPQRVRPPRAFRRDAHRIRALADTFATRDRRTVTGSENQDFAQAVEDFVLRWQPHIQLPEIRTKLDAFGKLARRKRLNGDLVRLDQTRELVEARMQWRLAQTALKAVLLLIDIHKTTTPVHRAELEKTFREDAGHDFDPEHAYRETVAHLDACERDFHTAWGSSRPTGQRKSSGAIHPRLLTARWEELKAWGEELRAEMVRLNEAKGARGPD